MMDGMPGGGLMPVIEEIGPRHGGPVEYGGALVPPIPNLFEDPSYGHDHVAPVLPKEKAIIYSTPDLLDLLPDEARYNRRKEQEQTVYIPEPAPVKDVIIVNRRQNEPPPLPVTGLDMLERLIAGADRPLDLISGGRDGPATGFGPNK